jgi:hypothetical protein
MINIWWFIILDLPLGSVKDVAFIGDNGLGLAGD